MKKHFKYYYSNTYVTYIWHIIRDPKDQIYDMKVYHSILFEESAPYLPPLAPYRQHRIHWNKFFPMKYPPRLFKEAGMKLLEGHVDVDVQCAEHHKWKSILLSCIGVSRVGYLQPWTNKTKGMYIYIYICMAKVAIEHSSLRHWIPPSSRASDPEV